MLFSVFLWQRCNAVAPATPQKLAVFGYEKHIELAWQANKESDIFSYKIFRSEAGKNDFQLWKTSYGNYVTVALDWLSDTEQGKTFEYKIAATNNSGEESATTTAVSAKLNPNMNDSEWLDMVQRATFRYFWDYAHPVSGLTRERNTNDDVVTIGGSGFSIMAILVGVQRGFITREEGLNHLTKVVSFLHIADRYHGVFPHWMDGNTGNTIPFSQYDDGADLVESSFLFQGLLTARQFFDKADPNEEALRSLITQLWEAAEFNWFRQGTANVLYWHWSPKYLWKMNFPLYGFNEAHIVYILAKASPKYSIPDNLYTKGWAGGGNYLNGQSYYGYKLPVGGVKGGPLFFSHYSYLGFDPRHKKDAYCNYFVRNQAHTYINRAYCIENPKKFQGYSSECWGLTASDTYNGYTAHEPNNDNGTITPTAALSSMPYTPTESLAAIKHFYRTYQKKVWGEFGFYDAFNVTKNWYATSYLAIDQGPIIGMIENYRSGLLWDNFMKNAEITPALKALGFVEDQNVPTVDKPNEEELNITLYPNPSSQQLSLKNKDTFVKGALLQIVDMSGKVLQTAIITEEGLNQVQMSIATLPAGNYVLIYNNVKKQFVKN